MKNGSRKISIIIVSCLMCLFISAYIFDKDIPNLINADDPFIDLDSSIGTSIGNAQKAYEKAHPTPVPTPIPTPEVSPEPTPTEIPTEESVKIFVGAENFSGSGELIYLEGIQMDSIESLKSSITSLDYDGKTFVLIDNYAENNTFKAVKKLLDESGISYHIEVWELER